MHQLSRLEQETTINWNAEEKLARIYTATPATIRKLDKLTAEFPEAYRCVWQDTETLAKRYEVNAKYLRFAKPASEAQKEAGRRQAAKTGFQALKHLAQ